MVKRSEETVKWHDGSFEARLQNIYGRDYRVGQFRELRPRAVRRHFPVTALLVALGLFVGFKAAAVAVVGGERFEAQRIELSNGSLPEKIGAALLKIDPLTAKAVELARAI